MSTSEVSAPAAEKVSFWVARNWQGMTLSVWYRLLFRHRFAIAPGRMPTAFRISCIALFNSGFELWEKWIHGDGIKRTRIEQDPLFVIGHWRTGTTLLHELLTRDEQFSFPSTFQCLSPSHFLSTQSWLPYLIRYMLPKKRPMDNMDVSWHNPQEDEFALANLSLLSPYMLWAFARLPSRYDKFLTLEEVSAKELRDWKKSFEHFVRRLTCSDPRRQVLKSPTHTARIKHVLEIFPNAQFIHIVRNPYVVFASTMKLWQRMWDIMGLSNPDFSRLEEYVFENLVRMYGRFEQDRSLLKPGQITEIRYEDLVQDILGQMQRIYEQLNLKHFDRALPKLQQYMDAKKDYKTNRFELPEETRQQIARRWSDYIQRYGYD